MTNLEMYKSLSDKDKLNLTIYSIYNSIYATARNENIKIRDEIVINIQELAQALYLKDEFYNFSESKIADFLTECYARDNEFLEKVEDIDYSDILIAIDDDDLEFYKDEEMER